MMIRAMDDGPYLNRFGHLFQPTLQLEVFDARGRHPLGASAPVCRKHVTGIQHWAIAPPIELRNEIQRSSGILRPGSSARSTIYAALLGKALLATSQTSDDPADVGVSVNSTTACGLIAWKFEQSGLLHGWENADTMLMPASIPTAVCTQIAAAVGARGTAVAIHGGAAGMCSAFRYAYACLNRRRVARFLLIGVDEVGPPHVDACLSLSVDSRWPEGCAGLLLTRSKPSQRAWRLGLLGAAMCPNRLDLPSPWDQVEICELRIESFHGIGTSSLIPLALLDLIESADGGVALLRIEGPGSSQQVIGLIQDEKTVEPSAARLDDA